jgi:MtN3 and saliva related transmembrane protein
MVWRIPGTIVSRTRRNRRIQRRQGLCNRAAEEMQFLETVIGVTAAMLTSLSYIPQVMKVRAGQPTEDLSLRMLIALTSGLVLWVVYGAVKADWIIIAANIVGTSLTGYVLYHKLQEPGRASVKHG